MKKILFLAGLMLYAANAPFTPPVSDLKTELGGTPRGHLEVAIPKDWRLAGVSPAGPNGADLWFQDSQGNVYMMSGFVPAGDSLLDSGATNFQFRKGVGRIPVEK